MEVCLAREPTFPLTSTSLRRGLLTKHTNLLVSAVNAGRDHSSLGYSFILPESYARPAAPLIPIVTVVVSVCGMPCQTAVVRHIMDVHSLDDGLP